MTHTLPGLYVRIDLAPGVSLGPGKAQLLEGIAATGSIAASGRRLNMSYKRAWQLVESLNRDFAAPLVSASRGGARGGGASLTPLGEQVLGLYREVNASARTAAASPLARLLALVASPPQPG